MGRGGGEDRRTDEKLAVPAPPVETKPSSAEEALTEANHPHYFACLLGLKGFQAPGVPWWGWGADQRPHVCDCPAAFERLADSEDEITQLDIQVPRCRSAALAGRPWGHSLCG